MQNCVQSDLIYKNHKNYQNYRKKHKYNNVIKHITLYQINILFEAFFYCISDRISLHKYKIKNY
jgi:hypothetical protein